MIPVPYKSVLEGMIDRGEANRVDPEWWARTCRVTAEAITAFIAERQTRLPPDKICLDDGGGK